MGERNCGAAEALARRAHAGQVDKAGRPYIEHVERVAAAVRGDDIAETVAWLHDVLEDQPEFAEQVWRDYPLRVLIPVLYLTRSKSISHYYQRIARDPVALKVKLADIADNANEDRLALLDTATADRLRRKYAKAIKALTP